jgi:hypothetical protein
MGCCRARQLSLLRNLQVILTRLNVPFSDRLEFLRQKSDEPTDDPLVLTTVHASKGCK